ncbi:26S proteasome non-ATPase regulatory subunit 10 [Patella vulgata]|uniref:26S proteasome non-ATPase regulatory subunit 10 n=1 Tax=Patella vulgata TaxID=6465 RepID=UPI0024A9C206|nr:26S proteasome non-ATPase regulatory subunit 10 [Patella vulgata]
MVSTRMNVENFIEEYKDYLMVRPKWHFCVVLILFLLYMTKSNQSRRKRKKVKQNVSNEFDIFDLAKTGYKSGHTELVIDMVEATDYDVNYIPPSTGLSLFLCACVSGQERLIRYLLRKGGDINNYTEDGDSALYLATFGVLNSEFPNPQVIKLLLTAGCEVNQQNRKGFTPLHRAASKGNLDIIRCLVQHGANPNICNSSGIYALDSAINAGHLDAAKLLTINIENPHVWDVVEPHTPTHISLGLQSPQRKILLESSRPYHNNSVKVFT